MKFKNESGVALVIALLILVLMGAMLHAFMVKVDSSQKMIGMENRSARSYATGLAALENIARELSNQLTREGAVSGVFVTSDSLDADTLTEMAQKGMDVIPKVIGQDSNGNPIMVDDAGNEFTIHVPQIRQVEAMGEPRQIKTGVYEGMYAQVGRYLISVSAEFSATGEKISLEREIQIYYVPVFQYGVFSEYDQEFASDPNFHFGGRVHANGDLYLLSGRSGYSSASSPGTASTLRLTDRVSAVGKILRTYRMNGKLFGDPTPKNGPVSIIQKAAPPQTDPNRVPMPSFRNLGQQEGNDGTAYKTNDPLWEKNIYSQYNGYLSNGKTGTRELKLPLVSGDIESIEIIRRSKPGEDKDTSSIFDERYFSTASVRILLSDTPGDITRLPSIAPGQPVLLQTGSGYEFAAESSTNLIGGYLKVEIRTGESLYSWRDVTSEILSYGFTGAAMDARCGENPNAIIRLQRFKDSAPNCNIASGNLWPNVIFDSREGTINNDDIANYASAGLYLGGIMHYIELDVDNLGKWIRRQGPYAAGSGTHVFHEKTGYIVYFSDRRGSQNDDARYVYKTSGKNTDIDLNIGRTLGIDVGEILNIPNRADDRFSDRQLCGQLEYLISKSDNPLDQVKDQLRRRCDQLSRELNHPAINGKRPTDMISRDSAKKDRPVFFRRAVKLVHGEKISLGTSAATGVPFGLTVASENPLYIQGNYNANASIFSASAINNEKCVGVCEYREGNHSVPAAVVADAVTLLSNNWKDANSFAYPYDASVASAGRHATTTHYRLAIAAGKNKYFPYGTSAHTEWGSDGGAHNYLRMLEYWTGSSNSIVMHYMGSFTSLFYSQQANSAFKFRSSQPTHVYSAPTRDFYFDSEFMNINKIPPRTPMMRDINILQFRRVTGDRK